MLTDQEVLAGIGNAYSDEILHAAKLSPFAMTDKLTDEQIDHAVRGDPAGARPTRWPGRSGRRRPS